ncbi:hypothetical protein DEO72_LG5g567 [Vigna unguiculata]|uniref:Disease resistance protein RPS4B/Roq1-like leucine-rich repeats domain-containing protein n=1 Tax=Vigna unguiculata TaxID=3917 RepID=A0A4D6LVQ0_VIGUN|nr:hypothetical protein DEO72_LG5g567 [Vigna unguiculata]
MGNIRELHLKELPMIKELPVSFQNLTGLQSLDITGCDFLQLNSSVLTPELTDFMVDGCKERKWVNSKDGEEVGSTVASNLRSGCFFSCLNDDFFSAGFTQLTKVTCLILWEANITFLPECIKEFHHLIDIDVSYCKRLQEIRGLPPNLRIFRAIKCTSLTSSGSNMLLNKQQLHEAGKTDFIFPGGSIPSWFDKQSRGPSITFWFRNKFPAKVLCLLIAPILDGSNVQLLRPVVLINGKVQRYFFYHTNVTMVESDYIQLFYLGVTPSRYDLIEMPLKEWKHVEVTYEGLFDTSLIKAMGIHAVKDESRSMEDIRYDYPYTTTQVAAPKSDGPKSWPKE